jgi:hypothetical protein
MQDISFHHSWLKGPKASNQFFYPHYNSDASSYTNPCVDKPSVLFSFSIMESADISTQKLASVSEFEIVDETVLAISTVESVDGTLEIVNRTVLTISTVKIADGTFEIADGTALAISTVESFDGPVGAGAAART